MSPVSQRPPPSSVGNAAPVGHAYARQARQQSSPPPVVRAAPAPGPYVSGAEDKFDGGVGHQPGAAAPWSPKVTRTGNSQEERLTKIHAGMKQLNGYNPYSRNIFHSTSSKAWKGLRKAGGLVPASQLGKYGIKRETGEGDMNTRAGERLHGIHFGKGPSGLGLAMAYFQLNDESPTYSPHLYTYRSLKRELEEVRYIVRNWNLPDGEYFKYSCSSGQGDLTVDLDQAQNRLRQLETEKALRDALPDLDWPEDTEPYPMMFDLAIGNDRESVHFEDNKYSLEGEKVCNERVMFKEHLQRVFVPVDYEEHAEEQLTQILGPNHSVAVIPMESLKELLERQRDRESDKELSGNAATAIQNSISLYTGLSNAERVVQLIYTKALKSISEGAPAQTSRSS